MKNKKRAFFKSQQEFINKDMENINKYFFSVTEYLKEKSSCL